MDRSIQFLIDQYLNRKYEESKARDRSGLFNASSFGRCFQYQVWNRENIEKQDFDARTLRVFKAGDLFHEFVQDIILKEYPGSEIEVTYQNDDIICRADIITPQDVISLKSQHSNAFWHMKRQIDKGINFKNIRFPHYLQVASECVFNNKENAYIVYISKDDLCIEQFRFENDEIMRKDVEDEISLLKEYWETKKPPAKARAYGYDKTGKPNECYKYCNFKDKCFELNGEPSKKGDENETES